MSALAVPLKRALRNAVNFPRYGPVALHDPQQSVEVWLEGPDEPKNVTRNNVVAALRPFTLGVMLDDGAAQPLAGREFRLCMRECKSKRLLGILNLRPAGSIPLPGRQFQLFECAGSANYCVSRLNLLAYHLRERWRAERRQRRNPHNFSMTYGDIWCSHVFYICPRPVVLVTVEHQGAGNMFPMDLIGPTDSPWFSMALRLTSPAVKLIEQSRRLALAAVPYSYKSFAYDLGKHHSKTHIEWDTLPFPLKASPQFRLPVAEGAPRVREVRVEELRQVGSHMLFLTSMVSDTLSAPEETLLFHAFYGDRHPPSSGK